MSWLSKVATKISGGDLDGFRAAARQQLRSGTLDFGSLLVEYRVKTGAAEAVLSEERQTWFSDSLATDFERDRFDRSEALEKAGSFGLSGETADRLVRHFAASILTPIIGEVLKDNIVEPSEDARINQALARLKGVNIGNDTQNALDDARQLWRAYHADLEPVQAPILMKRGEICFYVVETEASEIRTKTVRTNYAGTSVRVKIVKGVYYNVGSVRAERQTADYEHSFGIGALCVTNQRLLWISPQKSISILNGNIVRYDDYTNALCVYRGTGKPQMFRYAAGDNRVATAIAVRAIEEHR